MNVSIERRPATKIAYVRHTGSYAECGPAWETLCAWAGPKGLLTPDTQCIGISYDDPSITPPEKIRYDAAITLPHDVEPEGAIGVREIPACEFARFTHHGPYERLEQTYSDLMGQWLPNNGRACDESIPCMEIYLNDPAVTPPEDLRTDVCIALIA